MIAISLLEADLMCLAEEVVQRQEINKFRRLIFGEILQLSQ